MIPGQIPISALHGMHSSCGMHDETMHHVHAWVTWGML
jgi:hypothetical protein